MTFEEVKKDKVYSSIIKMIKRIEELDNLKPELKDRTLNSLRKDLRDAISEVAAEENVDKYYAMSNVGTFTDESTPNLFDPFSVDNTSIENLIMCEAEIKKLDFDKSFNIWRIMKYFDNSINTRYVANTWKNVGAPEVVKNLGVRYESLLLSVMHEYSYFYLDSIAPKTIEDLTEDELSSSYQLAYTDYRESEYNSLTDFIYAYLSK
jgi:hypothetical protein